MSRLRHSLSDESTRAATVLGSWATIDGLIPVQEVVENIHNKGSRWAEVASGTVEETIVDTEESDEE